MSRRTILCMGLAAAAATITLSVSAQQFQAPVAAQAVSPGTYREHFAPNLGIYYRLVPYGASGGGYDPSTGAYDPSNPPGGGGYAAVPYPGATTYGARLTRYPVANSPAAYLQLEPGDMIVALDNLAIYGPNDVLGHRYGTSLVFINIRTGLPQPAEIYIP